MGKSIHGVRFGAIAPALLLAALLAAGCQQGFGWVDELANGDYSKLCYGQAPATLEPVEPNGDLEQFVALARSYFDENQPLLYTIAGQVPCIESSQLDHFTLSGVWADTASGGMMLQFYAQYLEPKNFAGRRVQFVLDRRHALEAVYISDAPLEAP